MALLLHTPQTTAIAAKRRAAWVKWPWEERRARTKDRPLSQLELELQELDVYFWTGSDLLRPRNTARQVGRGRPSGMSWDRQRRQAAGMAILRNAASYSNSDSTNIVAELLEAGYKISGLTAVPPAAVAAGIKILTWDSLRALDLACVQASLLPEDWHYSSWARLPDAHLSHQARERQQRYAPIIARGFSISRTERERLMAAANAAAEPSQQKRGARNARRQASTLLGRLQGKKDSRESAATLGAAMSTWRPAG